jgi:hypothetical protein
MRPAVAPERSPGAAAPEYRRLRHSHYLPRKSITKPDGCEKGRRPKFSGYASRTFGPKPPAGLTNDWAEIRDR